MMAPFRSRYLAAAQKNKMSHSRSKINLVCETDQKNTAKCPSSAVWIKWIQGCSLLILLFGVGAFLYDKERPEFMDDVAKSYKSNNIFRVTLSFFSKYAIHAVADAATATPNVQKKSPKHGDLFTNSIGMKFVFIGPGTFLMGSPKTEKDREANEQLHKVTLTKGFWLQTTEVTQGQWQAVMGDNPSNFASCGGNCPVEQVSWEHIQDFILKLNRYNDPVLYRLPTEAEWEYAARAGTTTPFYFGSAYKKLNDYGWHSGNSGEKTHPVAQKRPNSWGLYDMHGNVFEWCIDWYEDYTDSEVVDPTGPKEGTYHIIRGGSWDFSESYSRSAFRSKVFKNMLYFGVGFRLAAEP